MTDYTLLYCVTGAAIFLLSLYISFKCGERKGRHDYYDALTINHNPFTED